MIRRTAHSLSVVLLCACSSQPSPDPLPEGLPEEEIRPSSESFGYAYLATVGDTEDSPLFRIEDGVLTQGGFALASGGDQTVRLFDSTATAIGVLGREGQGPGEFRRIRSLHRGPGDSFLVWDAGENRLTALAQSGRAEGTARLSVGGVTERPLKGFVPRDVSALGSHVVVSSLDPRMDLPRGLHRRPRFLFVANASADTVWPIGVVAGSEITSDGRGGGVAPFGHQHFFGLTQAGVIVGSGVTPRVTLFSLVGDPIRYLRLPIEPASLDEATFDEAKRLHLARFQPSARDVVAERFELKRGVSHHPAFRELLTSSDGSEVWVRTDIWGAEGDQEWLAFDVSTLSARSVRLPTEAVLLDAVGNRALILTTDRLGREVIHLLRIRRA